MATILESSYGDAIPELLKLKHAIRHRPSINKVIARAGANVVRTHFARLAMTNRNKWGRPSTFWKRMRQAITEESSWEHAAVVMEREVAQRRFGGVIKPTGGRKFLTIPMSKEAYGRTARSFSGLFLIKIKNEGAFLVRFSKKLRLETKRFEGPSKKRKEGKMLFMYRLMKSVTQKANRAILPTDTLMAYAIKVAIATWLKLKTKVT